MISKQIYIPEGNRLTSVKDTEGQVLASLILQHELTHTLEIGLAYGLSAAYILSAHDGPHVCVDPFQTQDYQDIGVRNIESLGHADRLVLHRDQSQLVLPKLWAEEAAFDFVFIDGGHRYDEIFVDFYFVDRLLRQNGVIVFHDMWLRGTQLVMSFIKNNRRDFEIIRTGERNLGVIRKIGKDERPWYHFEEFYNRKAFLRHKFFRLKMSRSEKPRRDA